MANTTKGFTSATEEEVATMKDDNGKAIQVVYTKDNIMMNSNTAFFSSLPLETRKDKIRAYNAITNTESDVADNINGEIDLVDLIVTVVDIVDEETGELEKAPRVILIDADGKAYNSVSKGMHQSVKNLVATFGEPSWKDEPIKVKIKQVKVKRGSMLTLEVIG